jgi:hypothetical protein
MPLRRNIPRQLYDSPQRSLLTRRSLTSAPRLSYITSTLLIPYLLYGSGLFLHRPFVTSSFRLPSLLTFFRRRSPYEEAKDSLQNAITAFISAVSSQRLDRVKLAYRVLADSKRTFSLNTPPWNDQFSIPIIPYPSIDQAMQLVSLSSDKHDSAFLLGMFDDLSQTFQREPTVQHFEAMLRSYTNSMQPDAALEWLVALGEAYEPSHEAFYTVLQGFSATGNVSGMDSVLTMIQDTDIKPTVRLYNAYLQGIFNSAKLSSVPVRIANVNDVLATMERHGVEMDRTTLATLLFGSLDAGLKAESRGAADLLRDLLFQEGPQLGSTHIDAWNALIRYVAESDGLGAARLLITDIQSRGLRANSGTLESLLLADPSIQDVADMRRLEAMLHVTADQSAWRILITRSTEMSASNALSVYEEAKSSGIRFSPTLLHGVFEALCAGSRRDVETAVLIYNDLIENVKAGEQERPSTVIYSHLFHGIAKTYPSSFTTVDTVLKIINDMQIRSLSFPPETITPHLLNLISTSPSHPTAFKIYRAFRDLNPSALDTETYNKVLSTFNYLSFKPPGSEIAPRDLYFDILKDMREARHPITPTVYTLLLQRYAALASHKAQSNAIDRIRRSTERIHQSIKLDASISPDVHLFNALMSAYSSVGAYYEAFDVWEHLTIPTPIFNGASVSIILDTCGFAGTEYKADQIWDALVRMKYPLNKKHWETRLECYARLGKFQTALHIFLDMCNDTSAPEPDLETARIMLKYSWKFNRRDEVKVLIRERLPHLYSRLPSEDKFQRS